MNMQGALFVVLTLAVAMSLMASPRGTVCVHWGVASFTTALVEGPNNATLIEYFVLFRLAGNYRAASILANERLTLSQLVTFAPVSCVRGSL